MVASPYAPYAGKPMVVPKPPTTPSRVGQAADWGLRLGLVGGVTGLGWSLLANRGAGGVRATKPMVVGMLIGSALGAATGYQATPRPQTERVWPPPWVLGMSTVKNAQSMLPAVANELSYWVPGLGTARMGLDTVASGLRGWKHLFRGNLRAALAAGGSTAANALFTLASLAPLGGAAVRGVRLATRGAKSLSTAGRAAQLARAGKSLGRIGYRAGGRMGMLAGLGLGIGGGIGEGLATAPVASTANRAAAASWPGWMRYTQNRVMRNMRNSPYARYVR